MSSLFICNPVKLTQDELSKITSGSGVSPAALLGAGGPGGQPQNGYEKIAAALEASEARERKTTEINRMLALGSFGLAVFGLYLTWSSMRRRD